MSFKAEIIADSLSPQGDRLTTFVVTFPRIVLAEFNTHRMFSRNSASSRAIPFEKMVKMVEENPFIPIAWQKDHKGMQGTEYFFKQDDINWNIRKWLVARDHAVNSAKYLNAGFPDDEIGIGVTKQLCNRLLEPFMWHTVIITSGEEGLENFFSLRCPQYRDKSIKGGGSLYIHKSKKEFLNYDYGQYAKEFTDLDWLKINESQAEIHIQAIAELMWDAYNESTPKKLKTGEWHIPFGDNINNDKVAKLLFEKVFMEHFILGESEVIIPDDFNKIKIKIATARCARVSYLNYEGNDDYEADIKLFDRLANMKHYSPFEHVARAMSDEEYNNFQKGNIEHTPHTYTDGWCRNFKGFIQLRETIEQNG